MKGLVANLALVSMLGCAATSWAYFPHGYFKNDGSGFIPVRYDLSTLPNSTLTFYINRDRLQTVPQDYPIAALFGDLKAATDVWSVSTSALRLRPGGFTSLMKFNGPAGVLSFTPEIAPGVVVVSGYETGPLPKDDSVAFIPITASFITLPHDISGLLYSGIWDEIGGSGILDVLVHGIGGAVGLNNSHIQGERTQLVFTNMRGRLSADDIAGISTLYPTDEFQRTTGQMAGWVTDPAGKPVALGAVTAYNDSVAIGTYTNPDGTFLIRGLPPGSYRLAIQPLMGGARGEGSSDPNRLGPQTTLGGGVVSPNLSFGANFLSGIGDYTFSEQDARVFDVKAGGITYARIWGVPARGKAGMDAFDVESDPSRQRIFVPSVWVQQGGQVQVDVEGHQMVDKKGGLPQVGFTGARGLEVLPSGFSGSLDPSTSPPWYDSSLSFTVKASPDATPGIRSIIYIAPTDPDKPGDPELYFSAGYVHIVKDPPPAVTSISPTSGTGGTAVTVTGSAFTDSSKVFFGGLPAAIVSRSPTSLQVIAPRGAAGHSSGVFLNNPDGQGSDFFGPSVRFTYDPAIPAPEIAVAPTSVPSGQDLLIRVIGTNTHFVQGETFVGFGSGDVVINSVTVSTPTSLTADVTVNAKVGEGLPVTVVTGEEVGFLKDAFRVVPAPPAPPPAAALPLTLQVVSGNGQVGAPGSQLPAPLVVKAQDATGKLLGGVKVNFSVQGGGGTVSPTSAITDDNGLASTVLTLGPVFGLNPVAATADQFQSAGFVLAGARAAAGNLRLTGSGNNQTATAGQELPKPLVLTVVDASTNKPFEGLPVAWRVSRGGGVVVPAFTITDASGTVTAHWKLGPTAGPQTLEATLSGFSPIVFKADAR